MEYQRHYKTFYTLNNQHLTVLQTDTNNEWQLMDIISKLRWYTNRQRFHQWNTVAYEAPPPTAVSPDTEEKKDSELILETCFPL